MAAADDNNSDNLLPGSNLDAALRYADIGWPVFPCKPDKKPATEHGYKDATTDHAKIVAWWRRMPDAPIGVATGEAHLCVIDLDFDPANGKDGPTTFAQLASTEPHGCGLIASTPRGGRHYFYMEPDPPVVSGTDLAPGIDVRGTGGYVVVPSGSPGREWMIGDPWGHNPDGTTDVAMMPAWVRDLVSGRRRDAPQAASTLTASARARIEASSALHAIPPSVGRSVWLQAIFAVHAALNADQFGARLVEAWSALSEAVAGDGKPQYRHGEAARIYRDALLPEFLAGRQSVDSGTLWALARDYGWRAAGRGADEVEITLGVPPTAVLDDGGGELVAKELPPPTPLPKPGQILLSDWADVAAMPPIEWQIEGLVPEQSLVLLAGDTEAGKSFLALDLALRMVHGMPFCGLQIEPGSVIYLAGEGHAGLAGRLNAWRRHHMVGEGAAGERYLVTADGIPPLSLKTMSKTIELVDMVAREKGHPPKLVVVDTLSQGLLDGDENDASTVAPVLRGLSDLRKCFGSSVLLAHHLVKLNGGKGPPAKPSRDSIRGSGALTRNVDTILGLVVESGKRILKVWKQKDGEHLPDVGLQLLVVETGRRKRGGALERSCVLIPDVNGFDSARETSEEAAERKRRATLAENVRRVVDVIREAGGELSSILEIRERSGMGMAPCTTAVNEAIRRGLVLEAGSTKRRKLMLPEVAGASREGGGDTPPTPPSPEESGVPDGTGLPDEERAGDESSK